jgi:uncharacterized protein (TIGR03435 family)
MTKRARVRSPLTGLEGEVMRVVCGPPTVMGAAQHACVRLPFLFAASEKNVERMIQLTVRNQSIQQVVDTFSIFPGRPNLDRTGLKGEFDFTMEYAADPDAADLPGAELAGPALFTALQEQAGLKLESTKGTVEVIVIDHADKPSEN